MTVDLDFESSGGTYTNVDADAPTFATVTLVCLAKEEVCARFFTTSLDFPEDSLLVFDLLVGDSSSHGLESVVDAICLENNSPLLVSFKATDFDSVFKSLSLELLLLSDAIVSFCLGE